MEPYRIIQKRVSRPDSVAKVTGQAKFTTDLVLPGMLVGKILRSPRHHARILHLDPAGAFRVPGVKAVITARDLPPVVYGFGDRPASAQAGWVRTRPVPRRSSRRSPTST